MFQFKKSIHLVVTGCLLAIVTCTSSFALNVGTITANSLNLRESPSTTSSILAELSHGRMVAVLEQGSSWSKIAVGSQTGYVSSQYLKNYNCDEEFAVGLGITTANSLNIRNQPNTDGDILTALTKGSTVNVIGIAGGWFKVKVDSITGYACSDYISVTTRSSSTSRGDTSTSDTATVNGTNAKGSSIVATTIAQIGKPYVSGAKGPNAFDCSGLTYYVYRQNGYTLAANSASQYSNTSRVSKSDLQPGDLVFFSNSSSGGRVGHVGIYVGSGQYIHAPSAGKTVCYSSLSSSWSQRHYISGGRIS